MNSGSAIGITPPSRATAATGLVGTMWQGRAATLMAWRSSSQTGMRSGYPTSNLCVIVSYGARMSPHAPIPTPAHSVCFSRLALSLQVFGDGEHLVGSLDGARVDLIGALRHNEAHHLLHNLHIRRLQAAAAQLTQPVRAGCALDGFA